MTLPRITVLPGVPDFLDLPWELPVNNWEHDRLVTMPTGIHRHPVVFVAYEEGVFVVKELPSLLAHNEFTVLGELSERTTRVAEPAGLVERMWVDPLEEMSSAVITRFVTHAFPFRRLVTGGSFGTRRTQMLDAMAGLLVELHLGGCFWGDCSLSNVLYRYDAGAIEAIMIDAETSKVYRQLSSGQRLHDIEIMKENLAGEMADIASMDGVAIEEADLALGDDVETRYRDLWGELFEELVIRRDETYRMRQRIGRLNDLGFSVNDVEIEPADGGVDTVRMRVHVGGRTFNSDKLSEATGIDASENQAKVIWGDVRYFLAKRGLSTTTGKTVGVFRWLTESYEPIVGRIRIDWHGDDPVQGYCDFLQHRLTLATERGSDVDNDEAYVSWVAFGFPGFPVVAD